MILIGKIAIVAALLLGSFFTLGNMFKFDQSTVGFQMPPIPLSIDPKAWMNSAQDFLWNLTQNFSGYISEYFKNIFPKATGTFGMLMFLLVILFFAWLLSSKFEHLFKTIILVAILICFVFLIMSALGFV